MIPNLSWGSDFSGLTNYLVVNRDHVVLDLRGVSSIERAPDEMQAVAIQSQRVGKPVMHVSFAAAIEDGTLADATWLDLFDAAEREFGLSGHQRVIVRHRDKGYDHIHGFWCTVHEDTGQTPPKQWFRTRGAARPELDQRALDETTRATFAPQEIVRGAFNRFGLARLMSICRDFERTKNLRRLRDRKAAAAARGKGERRSRPVDRHREERTGRPPIIDFANVVREALDEPDYWRSRVALNLAGFDLEPATRTRKDGTVEVRGLIITDLADAGNRATASSFDLPDRRYGLRQIEKRHDAGALTIEQWWPMRGDPTPTLTPARPDDRQARAAYQELRDEHRRVESEKAVQRRHLAELHQREQRRLRARLMRLRRLRAARLPPYQRRVFYAAFAVTTRASIWMMMERRQARERMPLRRAVLPTWQAYRNEAYATTAPAEPCAVVTSVPMPHPEPQKDDAAEGARLSAAVAEQPASARTTSLDDDAAEFVRLQQELDFRRGIGR